MRHTVFYCGFILALPLFLTASAMVSMTVYGPDGQTPYQGGDIMAGQELAIVITSDNDGFWSGGVFITGDNRGLGTLAAVGEQDGEGLYPDSADENAGAGAMVCPYRDSWYQGFDLYTDSNAVAGEWFTLRYTATAAGDPNIGFYEYQDSWDEPNAVVWLSQVRSRDFNRDGYVDLSDFYHFTQYWQEPNCVEPNTCGGTDLDNDGMVDLKDLVMFADYWLWPLPRVVREPEPCPVDPNVICAIVDGFGNATITMSPNDTVTIYVDLETQGDGSLQFFNFEISSNDWTLGSIDNRARDPNDPPGEGTARILAAPNRMMGFDDWGPGYQDPCGIRFVGVTFGSGFDDGHLVSFEYTCHSTDEAVLDFIYWPCSQYTTRPILRSLTINPAP